MLSHMTLEEVNWKRELKDLAGAAKTAEEKAATEIFAKVLAPYLEKPEMLRTLLGKIQAEVPADALAIVIAQRKFGSLEELTSKLPRNIDVVTL